MVKEIEVRVGRTYNIGKFESLRLDYSISMPLKEGDSPSETMDAAADKLLAFVDRKALGMIKQIQKDRD